MSVVLKAGGWSSAAFLSYLDREEVTEAAFLDLLLEEDEQEERDGAATAARGPPAAQPLAKRGIRAFFPSAG